MHLGALCFLFLWCIIQNGNAISDKSYKDFLKFRSISDKSLKSDIDIPINMDEYYDEDNRISSDPRFMYSIQDDVKFTLYTKEGPKEGEVIQMNPEMLKKSKFDPSKFTKFMTHGFRSSGDSDTCQTIKNAYLEFKDVNVFVVDWSRLAGNPIYFFPAQNTKDIGTYYGSFIDFIIDNGGDPNKIHLIGHSLGAHVSGFAGMAVTKGNISRITGLDPAFPSFGNIQLAGGRLSNTVAQFVDIIHTSGGAFGIMDPIGHADFYPNGGTMPQPGCNPLIDVTQSCSHGLSWKFFKESINPNVRFRSYHCETFDAYKEGKCDGSPEFMGEYVTSAARGNYYLATSPEPTYAIDDVLGGDSKV